MKIKRYWFQIAAWAVCAALLAGLVFVVREDRRKTRERYAALQEQAEEAERTESGKREAMAFIFDKAVPDMYVDNIICWGDGEMAGGRTGSLPETLRTVTEENLFGSMKKAFSKVIGEDGREVPTVTVTNMGVGNEGMREILVRAGVNRLLVDEGFNIPSGTDPVELELRDDQDYNNEENKYMMRFAKQSSVGFGAVEINGVEGTLITSEYWYDSNHPRFEFVRDEEGSRVWVSGRTQVEIESAYQYIGEIPVFFFSDNLAHSVDAFVSNVESLVDRYTETDGEEEDSSEDGEDEEEYVDNRVYVVICTTSEGSDLDEAMIETFGSHYVRSDAYASEMTDKKYKALAQKVFECLDAQGCYDDVKAKVEEAVSAVNSL